MSLIKVRTVNLDVSELVTEIRKLREVIEQALQVGKPMLQPGIDFDPDDYCSVSYSDETAELVEQHRRKRVAGLDLGL